MGFRLEILFLLLLMQSVWHFGWHNCTDQEKPIKSQAIPFLLITTMHLVWEWDLPPSDLASLTSDFRVTNKKLILFNDTQTDDMSYDKHIILYLIWDKNSKNKSAWFFDVMVLDNQRCRVKGDKEYELFRHCHCHWGQNTGIKYVPPSTPPTSWCAHGGAKCGPHTQQTSAVSTNIYTTITRTFIAAQEKLLQFWHSEPPTWLGIAKGNFG